MVAGDSLGTMDGGSDGSGADSDGAAAAQLAASSAVRIESAVLRIGDPGQETTCHPTRREDPA